MLVIFWLSSTTRLSRHDKEGCVGATEGVEFAWQQVKRLR